MAETNIKRGRLIKLLVCICLLGTMCGTFYAYRQHQISARFAALRADGLKASDAGQASQAVELLGNYLSRYPADVDVLAAYARNCQVAPLPHNEHLSRGIWALSHLLRLQPDRLDARYQLMKLYDETGYYSEAVSEANIILTARAGPETNPLSRSRLVDLGVLPTPHNDVPPTDSELASLHANVTALLQKYPDALEAEQIRTRSLFQLQQYSEALSACERWIDADPTNIDAALIRVELFQDNRRAIETAKAAADYWTGAQTNKANNELLKGHTSLVYGSVDCIPLLVAAADSDPTTPRALQILVGDLDGIHMPDKAREVLVRTLAKDPKNELIRLDLIGRDWDAGELKAVVDLSADLASSSATPTHILGLRATAQLMLGQTEQVTRLLQSLTDRKNDREAAAWAALVQQFIDQRPDMVRIRDVCRTALEQNPRDYYLRHFLAETYAQSGERELAIHEWQRVTNENRSWALPALRLSQALLEAGRIEASIQAAWDALGRGKQSGEIQLALAEALTANIEAGHKEDLAKWLSMVDSLATQLPKDGRPVLLKVRLHASTGNPAEATRVVQAALDSSVPLPEQSWLRLASLVKAKHLGDGNESQLASACLARCQKDHGITPALAYAKAVAQPEAKAGLASFDADALLASRQPPSTQPAIAPATGNRINESSSSYMALSWDLARAGYLELMHDPGAITAWAALADRNPAELRLQRLVLSAQSVRADKLLSERCIDRIGKLTSQQDSSWRSARARWLTEFTPFLDAKKQPTPESIEARNLLNNLVAQTPDSVEVRLLSAQAFEHAGKISDAINELQYASNLSPELVSIRLHLAGLLEMEGDFDAVQQQIDQLSDKDLLGTDQRRQAAAIFAQQGDMARAVKLLEEDARTDAEADTASLLLAQLYARQDRGPQAKQIIEKLLAGHPNAAALRFAAGFYASNQDMPMAYTVMDRLGKDTSVEPGVEELIRAEFALNYESAAGPDKAISLFEAATKAAPANPLTWRSLVAVNLLSGLPDKALAAADAGLRAIPEDATLKAISRQPGMLKFASAHPELRPMVLYFVKDPSAGSAATSTLNAIYSHAESQKTRGISDTDVSFKQVLKEQLRELAAQYPRFEPLAVYLIQAYQTDSQYEEAIAIASTAERALPDSAAVAQAETQLLMTAMHYPEALASALRWADHVPTQRIPATLIATDALLALHRPVEAINKLVPLIDSPDPRIDGEILKTITDKYVQAQTAAGSTPDLAILMHPLLTHGAIGRQKFMRFAVLNLPPVEAEAWLQQAAKQMPDQNTPAGAIEQTGLSEMYSALGVRSKDERYTKHARQILQDLAATDKPPIELWLAIGTRFDADKDWAHSIPCYQKALVMNPGNLLAENNLAMDLARTGHATDGLPYIDAAVKAAPKGAELYDTRAFVQSKTGNFDAAAADTRTAIQLVPHEPRYHLDLVQILVDSNHRKEAIDELKFFDPIAKTLPPEQAATLKDLQTRLSIASAQTN